MPDLLPALKQAEAEGDINTVLARQLDHAGVKYIEEHRFHPPRRWRLDFYFPVWRLAVEIEGLNHRKRDRYGRDLEKYNTLSADAVFLLRFTAPQVHDETALHEILAYLEAHP
ncbi:endonuclease domain-containing protein [Deinococcus rubellus]|uniref:Endonuclease domain-containing protein n=1 Tax=Deinococcus rubellus TaxID=1889240 RepID=A0ABY5YKV9_9DEIO|nr:endonuclease domain-containing protein [Deinococcus rubellus]UWX64776.1 endonuclease domain-containing protein [Deinococcus rubellus]